MHLKIKHLCALLAVVVVLVTTPKASAQDLLGDALPFSGSTLNLKRYVDPSADRRNISLTTQPYAASNSNLFVTMQDGVVAEVADNGSGVGVATEWFNYNSLVNQAVANANNGYVLENPAGAHGGLRAVAFHPEFATNGKFYTSAMVDRPSNTSGFNYLGTSSSGFDGESLVAEWTYNSGTGQVDANSYRERFRVPMPVFDHPIKQITFNNFAQPGDEDYGLLYIAHGDGSVQSATAGGGLVTTDALGKVLRVNPLQDGANPYSIPSTNPYANDPQVLDEIYTLGHRNPHHISFARDGENVYGLIAEGGRDNIEEVNLMQAGGNYGWSDREGTFIHNNNGGPNGSGYGLDYGVSALPANEWQLNDYVYPAAQYDHNSALGSGIVSSIIAGGFVLEQSTNPNLFDECIFADFGGTSGHVYQASFSDILNSLTQLADGEAPTALTQAPVSRLMLTLDEDGDGTIDRTANNLNSLLQKGRNDVRFGRGPHGEMFISSKQTGLVYLITGTEPNDWLTTWSTGRQVRSRTPTSAKQPSPSMACTLNLPRPLSIRPGCNWLAPVGRWLA